MDSRLLQTPMDRRSFLGRSAGLVAGLTLTGGREDRWWPAGRGPGSELARFIRRKMEIDHIPGAAARIVNATGVVWEGAFGWADLERGVPMSLDTLQNIASISKIFTTTALMQQWEEGRFRLDDDVDDFLPFSVRSPHHPTIPITFRQLLTHQSPIRDGTAYSRGYICSDPGMELGDWLEAYLTPDGEYYDPVEHFHPWPPGEGRVYGNVSYGLVAFLSERIAGMPFGDLCRQRIFQPLGMTETSWFLNDIDPARHAIPYTWVGDGEPRGPAWGGESLGVIRPPGAEVPPIVGAGYRANCLYNHPNYPDGFLRTSVDQLSHFVRAHLSGGRPILARRTLDELWKVQYTVEETGRSQGLTWSSAVRIRDQKAWGHSGGDPGVNTDFRILPEEGVGVIVFLNTHGAGPQQITTKMLELVPEFERAR